MPVVISYTLSNLVSEAGTSFTAVSPNAAITAQPSLLALSNGGYALTYLSHDIAANTDTILQELHIGNTVITHALLTPAAIPVFQTSTTQLSNGNILNTWKVSGGVAPGIHYCITDSVSGAVITADALLGTTSAISQLAQAAALNNGGGFVVAMQNDFGAADKDADLLFYNAAGAFVTSVSLGSNSTSDERAPAVDVLTNGNVVVAYEKELADGSGQFGMAIEIFTATGAQVLVPYTFDMIGTQNLNPNVVALSGGGFAVVYSDNEYGTSGLSIAFFTAGGVVLGVRRVDVDTTADTHATVTELANGFVAVTWTSNGENIDSALFDPVTMLKLSDPATSLHLIESQSGQQSEPTSTALPNGSLVTAWTDYNNTISDGNVSTTFSHVSVQTDAYSRISTSDAAGDIINGDALPDIMSGNGGIDILNGGGGGDILFGGSDGDTLNGGTGVDFMDGGAGNDIFYVNEVNDNVVEAVGGGSDRIYTSSTYSIGLGQEVEILSATSNASVTNINLSGNEFNNAISGNNGINIINGGTGADSMYGYGNGDIYYVDNIGDRVYEAVNGGNDAVSTSVSFTLAAGQEIETLLVTNIATLGAINLTGNEFANEIDGNNGNNIINGGAGGDHMHGYLGNDSYYIDTLLDQVFEAAGGGTDRIYSIISYSLDNFQEIEYLQAADVASVTALNFTGNNLNNAIGGNNGANSLDGGLGADNFYGYGGNDFYFVDNVADRIFETVGNGIDRVYTSVSYTLEAGQEVEYLLTITPSAVTALNLTGNALNNAIAGNAGVNTISGLDGDDTLYGNGGGDTLLGGIGNDKLFGGNGNDTLTGNAGADTFIFDFALNATTNYDTVTDFVAVDDTIRLDHLIFTTLAAGALNANAFWSSAAGVAHDGDDRIIYNTTTGVLTYDSNGNVAGGDIAVATLSGAPAGLTSLDFLVI